MYLSVLVEFLLKNVYPDCRNECGKKLTRTTKMQPSRWIEKKIESKITKQILQERIILKL